MENLEKRLVKVIANRLGISAAQVVPEARIIQDLGADSLEIVDLIVAFEEEFDLLIPDSEARLIRTVREAMDYLTARLLRTA